MVHGGACAASGGRSRPAPALPIAVRPRAGRGDSTGGGSGCRPPWLTPVSSLAQVRLRAPSVRAGRLPALSGLAAGVSPLAHQVPAGLPPLAGRAHRVCPLLGRLRRLPARRPHPLGLPAPPLSRPRPRSPPRPGTDGSFSARFFWFCCSSFLEGSVVTVGSGRVVHPHQRSVPVHDPATVATVRLRLFYTMSCPIFWANFPFPVSGPAQCQGFFMTVNKHWGLLQFPTPPAWFFPGPRGPLLPPGTPPSATITTRPGLMLLPVLEQLSQRRRGRFGG